MAIPVRDRGIDLVAYLDRAGDALTFQACPIQLKANTDSRFGLHSKYKSIKNLLMTYVWNVNDPERTVVYALTYNESYELLNLRGHTDTHSWNTLGGYTLRVNETWMEMLEPYRMSVNSWPKRIETALSGSTYHSM